MQEPANAGKKTLTRNGLAQSLYADLGATGDAYRFVAAFFEVLSEQIVSSEEVKIHGFGKFRCLNKRQRVGRNPKTGEEVAISARRVVSFIAGGRFKRAMTGGGDDIK